MFVYVLNAILFSTSAFLLLKLWNTQSELQEAYHKIDMCLEKIYMHNLQSMTKGNYIDMTGIFIPFKRDEPNNPIIL